MGRTSRRRRPISRFFRKCRWFSGTRSCTGRSPRAARSLGVRCPHSKIRYPKTRFGQSSPTYRPDCHRQQPSKNKNKWLNLQMRLRSEHVIFVQKMELLPQILNHRVDGSSTAASCCDYVKLYNHALLKILSNSGLLIPHQNKDRGGDTEARPELEGCPSNPIQMRGVPPPHEKCPAVMRVRYQVSGFREPPPAILAHGPVKPAAPRSIVTAAASAIPLIMMKCLGSAAGAAATPLRSDPKPPRR